MSALVSPAKKARTTQPLERQREKRQTARTRPQPADQFEPRFVAAPRPAGVSTSSMRLSASRALDAAPVPEVPEMPELTITELRSWPLWQHLSPLRKEQLTVLLDPIPRVWKRARFGLNNLTQDEGFTTAAPEAQAKQVLAMLSVDPGNVALALADIEAISPSYTVVPSYELAPALRVPDFQFRGKVADAEKFSFKLGDQPVPIYQPLDLTYSKPHQHTVVEVAEALAGLPSQSRQLVSEVRLSPDENADNETWAEAFHLDVFNAYMSVDAEGTVNIYPSDTPRAAKLLRDNLSHEAGHVWSFRAWGQDAQAASWEPWHKAILADGLPVSLYGKKSALEDVAEATVLFLATLGTPRFADFKALYPNRFAILAAHFGEG